MYVHIIINADNSEDIAVFIKPTVLILFAKDLPKLCKL